MERNNLMNTQTPEAETTLEKEYTMDCDLMREYARQLNGEIEDHGEYRED